MTTPIEALGLQLKNPPIFTGCQTSGSIDDHAIESTSPIDGSILGSVGQANLEEYNHVIDQAKTTQLWWQSQPAPRRGEIVRQIGNALRSNKEHLGALVSMEMGKSLQEGLGEVQEMIDICDFAVGLSRQLHGLTMHSERPEHRMYEQWHPMGVVGIISAFNFPVAVWSWNAMIAAVCGNVSVWKPSSKTPLTAVACMKIVQSVFEKENIPEGVMNLVIGRGSVIGDAIAHDERISLVSATGSTPMGKKIGGIVGARLGRSILELGGNNAIIVTPDANLELSIPAILFGAVGTAGQRCTSTRRVIIHDSIYDTVSNSLLKAWKNIKIGSPLDEKNHVGPLIDKIAVEDMQSALVQCKEQGGNILYGGEVLDGPNYSSGCYVRPALVAAEPEFPIVQEETFAPILYLIRYSGPIENAIHIQNDVKQGLSSAIFTNQLQEAEAFLSNQGSDCGIANVNIGTSGAEIGGAFGGEKETGGGRESGSDAWKGYMRRQTNTINYGKTLPLAQGIRFEL
ncbi:MAG: aldehyde dehydrogenase family protein [Oligoflexales bacterium]